jgi:hypothetical protein
MAYSAMRCAVLQIDPLELDRRDYESLFDLMEDYRTEHPEASDDECFEAVCRLDIEKERHREQH